MKQRCFPASWSDTLKVSIAVVMLTLQCEGVHALDSSDRLKITFTSTGEVLYDQTVEEGSGEQFAPFAVSVFNDFDLLGNPNNTPPVNLVLIEPDGSVSDLITLSLAPNQGNPVTQTDINIVAVSAENIIRPPGAISIGEGTSLLNITNLLFLRYTAANVPAPLTVEFQSSDCSDNDPDRNGTCSIAVPEPDSAWIFTASFVAGTMLLLPARWRRKRQKR